MSTTLADVKRMSDTGTMFFNRTTTTQRVPANHSLSKELSWLRSMIKQGSLERHWYLRRRRNHNKPIPWWTSQETRQAWKRFQTFEAVCTVHNVWTLLMYGAITMSDVRHFCTRQPITPMTHNNLERAVAMFAGEEAHLQTLEGALGNRALWCSIPVATTIKGAVNTGEFRTLWASGYFDGREGLRLIQALLDACFIDERFMASLHEPTDQSCIAAGIATSKLDWLQLAELFKKRELLCQAA